MTSNREKFSKLVSKDQSNTLQNLKERKKNRAMLRESKDIAFKVLMRLDELKWKQKDLAEKLGVSKQQVTKIVSGKENLTLETLVKLQEALQIPLLVSFVEKQIYAFEETHKIEIIQDYEAPKNLTINIKENSPSIFQMSVKQDSYSYEYFPLAQ